MSVNLLKTRALTFNLRSLTNVQKCCFSSKIQKVLGDIEVEETPVYEDESKFADEEIERICNKSRLAPQHRNMLHGKAPYEESIAVHHDSVKWRRNMLGRYGLNAPNVNPKWSWPTKEEVEDIKLYESYLYPDTLQDVWKQIEEKKKQEALEIKEREEHIDKVKANFDKWRANLDAKIAKKNADLLAAKQRKEAVLEEIREQFGFRIDPKDERYQEALAQKEKEDKKRKKEEKKQKKTERFLAKLAKQEQEIKAKQEEQNKAAPKEATDNSNTEAKTDKLISEEKSSSEPDGKKTE